MNPQIISIVTPSYNQGQFIEETLQSVLTQEGEFYLDYIVVDGGSTDRSFEIIGKYETLLKENCSTMEKDNLTFFVNPRRDFRWHRCLGISYRWLSEKDNGQVHALNKGFNLAKGQIYAFLNSDDSYYPQTLNTICHASWGNAAFIYGQGMWISAQGREVLQYPTYPPSVYNLYYQCTLCQPAVFFRAEAFRRQGEFSMEFPDTFDYEYWLRAAFAREKFLYVKALLAKSRMHEENKSMGQRKDISHQVRELKETYYDRSPRRLSKLKLFLTQFAVQRKTVKQVNRLFSALGSDTRYHFWKKLRTFKDL